MKTLFAGRNRLVLADVESTNTWALELLRESEPAEGTIVITYNQRAGRGQRGNSWESEPFCNVAISMILYPRFLQPMQQFDLTRALALAVVEALENILSGMAHEPVCIKWPNDIFIGSRKVSGMLIENILRENSWNAAVAGIGVNVNQQSFSDAAPNASSLFRIAGKKFDLDEVVDQLCTYIEKQYLRLRAGKIPEIRSDYAKLQYGIHTVKSFRQGDQVFDAKILGTTDAGQLRLEMPDGTEEHFSLQELKLL